MEEFMIIKTLQESVEEMVEKYTPLQVIDAIVFRMKIRINDVINKREVKKIKWNRRLLRMKDGENWEVEAMDYAIKIYNSFSTARDEELDIAYRNYTNQETYLTSLLR